MKFSDRIEAVEASRTVQFTSDDFAANLFKKAGVAVVPGEAFGMGDHVRISYAVPEAKLIEGFERIASVL